MLYFRKLVLSDSPLLREKFAVAKSRLCDLTLGGVMMWRDFFATEIALDEEILYFKVVLTDGSTAFTVPLGNLEKGLASLGEYCASEGLPLRFCTVSEEDLAALLALNPSARYAETRDWFDYLYEAPSLLTFAGKKLSGQRNHRNRFLREHPDWHFEEISEGNIQAVAEFFSGYSDEVSKDSASFAEEARKVLEVLRNPDMYRFCGGVIVAEGKIVAMSMGETVFDTLFVHIEKASHEVPGAYQMIVSEFIRHFAGEGILYVNREEDVGDEGLRTSKLSYHPLKLLKKYNVTF